MLAPKELPEAFVRWNQEHNAPFGRSNHWLERLLPRSLYRRYCGPFAIQLNNTIRRFEYPWAFHAAPLAAGQSVLEIGGGLSGFQFVLDREGCRVVNVDPGTENEDWEWPCDEASMAELNRIFGTSVELRKTVVTEAGLALESFDRVFSLSVIEHLTETEIADVMRTAYGCLKPGGFFILTVDLFLDLAPFTSRRTNMYGKNVNLKRVTGAAPFVLEAGTQSELNGFPEFDPDRIQSNLSSYLIGEGYPALSQCLVLRKGR